MLSYWCDEGVQAYCTHWAEIIFELVFLLFMAPMFSQHIHEIFDKVKYPYKEFKGQLISYKSLCHHFYNKPF